MRLLFLHQPQTKNLSAQSPDRLSTLIPPLAKINRQGKKSLAVFNPVGVCPMSGENSVENFPRRSSHFARVSRKV